MNPQQDIRVAIMGGGLAGATLINALLKHPQLDVHIFESAPEFSERGAAVGLATSGQKALAEIGGNVAEALDRAGAVTMHSSRLVLGAGPNAGTIVLDLAPEQLGKVVHRAAFLTELLRPVPRERMHTNKKLTGVQEAESHELILHFEDGTQHATHALIGADGIFGFVRSHVLGVDNPALKPQFGGFWDCRSLVPIEKAREVIDEYLKEGEERQYGWVGDGAFFMHDVLDNGKTVQCVASALVDGDWDTERWSIKLDRGLLEKEYSSWNNSPIKDGMIRLLLENPDLKAYPQMHYAEATPTFSKGTICLMGDAAHATTPWQGSGACMALEDAMILETLLREVKNPGDIETAFQAYDAVRRPRTQHIIVSSQETGVIMCGRGPDIGLDVNKIRETLAHKWDFISNLDHKAHKTEAVAAMKAS